MVEKKEDRKEFREIPINNPFIRSDDHWDRDNELYDKVKVIIDLAESSRGEIFLRSWIFFMRLIFTNSE